MKRLHTFVMQRELQFLLVRTLSETKELNANDINYRLDVEFSNEFDRLIERYEYSEDEAIRLINSIRKYESHSG